MPTPFDNERLNYTYEHIWGVTCFRVVSHASSYCINASRDLSAIAELLITGCIGRNKAMRLFITSKKHELWSCGLRQLSGVAIGEVVDSIFAFILVRNIIETYSVIFSADNQCFKSLRLLTFSSVYCLIWFCSFCHVPQYYCGCLMCSVSLIDAKCLHPTSRTSRKATFLMFGGLVAGSVLCRHKPIHLWWLTMMLVMTMVVSGVKYYSCYIVLVFFVPTLCVCRRW